MPLDVLGSGWYSILNDPLSLLSILLILLGALRAFLGTTKTVKIPPHEGSALPFLLLTPLIIRGRDSGLGLAFILDSWEQPHHPLHDLAFTMKAQSYQGRGGTHSL